MKRVIESPEQQLLDLLAPKPGERVLDAGCGLGQWSAAIHATGAHVTGVDIHAPMLEQARYLCPDGAFLAADLLTWNPDAPFDAIYAFATLHWVRPEKDAASALHKMLRKGGRLACAFGGLSPTALELDGCYKPKLSEYTRVLKRAGFAILEERELDRHFLILAEAR